MLHPNRRTLALLALAALPVASYAQGSGINMPWERNFWGYAGASLGANRLRADCVSGFDCDRHNQGLRVFGGGRFNDIVGGEIGFMKLGDFSRAGGELDSKVVDISLIAGIPFANNWNVFAKLGAVYGNTDVSAAAGSGVQTGSANGWGAKIGAGLQMGLTDNWALRLDLDRYRIKVPGGHEDVDSAMLGAQYTFR